MFTSLTVKNFKAFKELTIEPLARVNLIGGRNDVGKTALLEAVFLLLGEANPILIPKLNALRGLSNIQGDPEALSQWLWSPLFHDFETERTICVFGERQPGRRHQHQMQARLVPRASAVLPFGNRAAGETGMAAGQQASKALQIQFQDGSGSQRTSQLVIDERGIRVEPPPPSPSIRASMLSANGPGGGEEDAHLFGQLEVSKEPYDLLQSMKIVEPRLTRVRTVLGAGGALLWGDIGLSQMLPIALMGDGLARFTSIILRIASARDGVVLVDEIENGLHHKVMPKVWATIAEAARAFNAQLFATTHSWECIQDAHTAFVESGNYDIRFHRLDRVGDQVRAVTYDQETLAVALKSELEVR